MRQPYIELRRFSLFGARVHAHWTVLAAVAFVVAVTFADPLNAVAAVLCYFAVILLHEAGHALFAHRLGYRVYDIYLSVIHGRCVYEAPRNDRDEAIIAWGGVAAQLAVALPLCAVGLNTDLPRLPGLGAVFGILGLFSVVIALMNLIPVPSLDGGKAWGVFGARGGGRPQRPKTAQKAAKAPEKKPGSVVKGPWEPR